MNGEIPCNLKGRPKPADPLEEPIPLSDEEQALRVQNAQWMLRTEAPLAINVMADALVVLRWAATVKQEQDKVAERDKRMAALQLLAEQEHAAKGRAFKEAEQAEAEAEKQRSRAEIAEAFLSWPDKCPHCKGSGQERGSRSGVVGECSACHGRGLAESVQWAEYRAALAANQKSPVENPKCPKEMKAPCKA